GVGGAGGGGGITGCTLCTHLRAIVDRSASGFLAWSSSARRIAMTTLMPERFGTMVDDQPHDFRVSTSAYRAKEVFEAELENIFYKTWIYLCHESELEAPGSFKSTQIGTRPVIVTKAQDGQVRAMLNV